MGKKLEHGASEMVLCGACSDVVDVGASCPTCGESNAASGGVDPGADLDGPLLDRVNVALAAEAELAGRTTAQRVEAAGRLLEESVVLRGRLRRQRALLRARVGERKELVPALRAALDRVQSALDRADQCRRRGDPWRMTARLPRDPSCARVARRLLAEYARAELDECEASDAMLIASELASNAFLHGDGAIVLKVARADDRLRVEVLDEGHHHVGIVPEKDRQEGGRGLWIIDQLARSWGTLEGGGHVWAELAVGGGRPHPRLK